MMSLIPGSPLFAALVALVPAVLRWHWGRALAPRVDEPVFAERLAAHRQRTAKSFIFTIVALVVGWTSAIWWTIPLMAVSCAIGSYPLRRAIYNETWSIPAYLSFFTRLIIALFGFWILLAATPALAVAAGENGLALAGALAIGLLSWNIGHSASVRLLLRTRPVDDPALVARFTALAQKTEARMPRFERVDLYGGMIANAIALPSLKESSVVFSESLLTRLDADAIVAICAHELAHLEHFNPRYLHRLNVVNVALIAASFAGVVLSLWVGSSLFWMATLWPCVVVAAMAWRVRGRQQHETESDLRAVALTGDPEALARGLSEIHAYAHVPRRVGTTVEQNATHPSLARRIRAIRGAVAAAPPAISTDVKITAAVGNTEVVFTAERLEWREGDAAVHSLSYAHLAELRLDASTAGPPRLVAVERSGRRWELPVAPNDVAKTQAVLDLVDGRLPDPVAPAGPHVPGRMVAVIAASFSFLGGYVGAGMLALLAFWRPSPQVLGASGAGAIAAAGLMLRDPIGEPFELSFWPAIGLALAGAGMFASAWAARKGDRQVDRRFLAALAAFAALPIASTLVDGLEAIRLYETVQWTPSTVVFPIALAGALLFHPSRKAYVAAILSALVGIAAAVVGTHAFLYRFGTDPLLVQPEPIVEIDPTAFPKRDYTLPFFASNVRLSPGGLHVAAQAANDYAFGRTPTFRIGAMGGTLSDAKANDVLFLDDSRALLLREQDDGAEISTVALDRELSVTWKLDVPDIHWARLSARSESGTWELLGWNEQGAIVRAAGVVGTSDIAWTRWPSPDANDDDVSQYASPNIILAASGRNALFIETSYEAPVASANMLLQWMFFLRPPMLTTTKIWRIGSDGAAQGLPSRMQTQCFADALGDDRVVCAAFDGTHTRFVALRAGTDEISPIGTLPGHFASQGRGAPGWLIGWCDSTVTALQLAKRQSIAVERGVLGIAANDQFVATISTSTGSESKVRLYALGR